MYIIIQCVLGWVRIKSEIWFDIAETQDCLSVNGVQYTLVEIEWFLKFIDSDWNSCKCYASQTISQILNQNTMCCDLLSTEFSIYLSILWINLASKTLYTYKLIVNWVYFFFIEIEMETLVSSRSLLHSFSWICRKRNKLSSTVDVIGPHCGSISAIKGNIRKQKDRLTACVCVLSA